MVGEFSDHWKKIHKEVRKNLSEVPNWIKDQFNSQFGIELDAAVNLFLQMDDPATIWDLAEVGKQLRWEDGEHGIGARLLQETRWRGILDLEVPRVRQRYRNYVTKRRELGKIK